MMYLQLLCEPSDDFETFLPFLIENIKQYVKDASIYDQRLSDVWCEYFQTLDFHGSKVPTVKDVMIGFANNLTYRQDYEGYSIYCDDNDKYANTAYSYYQLAAIINSGTLDCKAYPIVDQMIQYFEDHVEDIIQLWRLTSVNKTV